MLPEHWPAFLVVLLVVLCTPGPDFVVVLRYSLLGTRAGYRAVAGIVGGLSLHTIVAAVGLAALIAARPWLLDTLRLAGAAFLAWLGTAALRACLARSRHHIPHGVGDRVPASNGAASSEPGTIDGHPFRDGMATNALNPKALLFFIGLLPQFVSASGHVTVQTLILTATTMVTSALWWIGIVQLGSRAARWLSSVRARRIMDAVSGIAFLGFAVWVALPPVIAVVG
ncbi:LysE family translocator [Actinobacteria bacterium YIM 96077]|uniref:LysE family translocator n=1 Tax=Phytoactinopolyspora halophila TaxID=1981511 RepID=A0A329QSY6_9ACTN|nr:LysE family translocator [Phytoactinopolyspora halophila]AYY14930.1 LysE family translocator [Actinobacteria bacterium YIM 96077]RAW15387.1 LysE family translocator [Phytoactinopolyspora halophila]